MFEKLTIPNTLAAGPGPGNTDPRVLKQFSKAGLADHMHPDVLRGMKECKFMLREVWGTKNIHTFGVAGTGWSGLDAVISAVKPGDKVVAFVNGTFSTMGILQFCEAGSACGLFGWRYHKCIGGIFIQTWPYGLFG